MTLTDRERKKILERARSIGLLSDSRTEQISIRMRVDTLKRFSELSNVTGKSRSTLIAELATQGLDSIMSDAQSGK